LVNLDNYRIIKRNELKLAEVFGDDIYFLIKLYPNNHNEADIIEFDSEDERDEEFNRLSDLLTPNSGVHQIPENYQT